MFKLVVVVLTLATLGIQGRPYTEENEVFDCNGKANGYYADTSDRQSFFSCHEGALLVKLLCEDGFEFDGTEGCAPVNDNLQSVEELENEALENLPTFSESNYDEELADEEDVFAEGSEQGIPNNRPSGPKKVINIEISKNIFPRSFIIVGRMNREQKNKRRYDARNKTMFNTHIWTVITLQLLSNGVKGVDNTCRFTVANENAAWLEEDGSLRFPLNFQENDADERKNGTPYTELDEETICMYSNVTNNATCKYSIDFEFLRMLKDQRVRTLTIDSYGIGHGTRKRRSFFDTTCVQKIAGELFLEDIRVEMSTILSLRKLSAEKLTAEGEVFSNKIIKIGWKYGGEVTLIGTDTISSAEVSFVSDEYQNEWDLIGRIDFLGKIGTYRGNVTYQNDVIPFRGVFEVINTGEEREFYGNLDAIDINVQGHFLGNEVECLRTEITIPRGAFSNMTIKNLVFKDSNFFGDFHKESFEGINQLETIKFRKSMMQLMPEYESIFRVSTLKAIYIENCNTPSIKTGFNCSLNNLQLLSFEGKSDTFVATVKKGSGFLEFSNSSFLWLSCSKLTYLSLHDANIKLIGNEPILHPVGDKLRYIDLSYSTLTQETSLRQFLNGTRITHLSLAGLQLKRVPATALETVGGTLKYLSLRGNNFQKIPSENMLVPILNFPKMKFLRVLDLGGCNINYIEKRSFDLLTNLEMLDLSHNYIVNLQDGWVEMKPNILHLNLSHNDFSSRASAINLLEAMDLSNFDRLQTLDLSYSNFWSERLISSLHSNLRYVSLCKCGLKSINDSTLQGMENVEEIDLSGNPFLGKTISMNQFKHMRSLKKLHLAHSGLANLRLDAEETWENLEYIDLSNNYIKMVDSEFFKAMSNVKILKLSYNNIWFWPDHLAISLPVLQRVFLDNNKIEKLKSQTILDFAALDEITLGNNPFVCDRFVLSFLNLLKKKDSQYYLCPEFLKEVVRRRHSDEKYQRNRIPEYESGRKIYLYEAGCAEINDWTVNEYQCYSQSSQKVIPFENVKDEFEDFGDDIDFNNSNSISLALTAVTLICFFCGFIWWKWWNLRLFTKMMKNAAVTSFLEVQDREATVFEYDVFVSYNDSDRQWVTDRLIPNLEKLEDVKMCLHERDFQVGLSILENISTCIDKSRCVIFVMSQAFVKSQWCRFEMHMAHHRLLENKRNHVILIFIENIPRSIRPKTLQYLMMTTTYLQWPTDSENAKESEIFWNRLFKAVKQTNYIYVEN